MLSDSSLQNFKVTMTCIKPYILQSTVYKSYLDGLNLPLNKFFEMVDIIINNNKLVTPLTRKLDTDHVDSLT